MKYKKIPYVTNAVSQIFFGTGYTPFLAGEDCNDLLDAVYAMGINTLDTARMYGRAEESVGRWLRARENRADIVIISKCAHHDVDTLRKRVNEKEIREDFSESARLLGTDFIDIYLLHRDDPRVPAGEICEIFNALHAEGKIGAFGGSNWTIERIEQVNEYAYKHNLIPFTVSSPNFGLADQMGDPWGEGCEAITGPSHVGARGWYEKNQMPVIAYASLAHGFLSGKLKSSDMDRAAELLDPVTVRGYSYPENYERLRRCEILSAEKGLTVPQIAMAWIYAQKLNAFAVVSTSSPQRMRQNVAAIDIPLTENESQWLNLERDTLE